MKKLLLLICFIGFANNTYAQDPALLDNEWFIDYFELDGVTYNNPIVNAIGIINSNMAFETDHAYAIMDPESDSFFAEVTYDPVDPALTFFNMGITLPGCYAWCEFASKYFDFLIDDFVQANFTYEIIDNGDDTQTLIMTRDDGNFAVFQDSKILGLDEQSLSAVRVFPNPTHDLLFIESESEKIEQVAIYDNTGRQIVSTTTVDNSIDVSNLTRGLYFLEITTENGKAVERFIKE